MIGKNKILYIDDEEINLLLFSHNFSHKYDIITEFSGKEGLNSLKIHQDIKVVISDMKMPGMNGLEFIKEARAIYEDKAYFILTGYDITDEIKKALDAKLIASYFRKPFEKEMIEAEIDKAINR